MGGKVIPAGWTAEDEAMYQRMHQQREAAIRAEKQVLLAVVAPALTASMPRIDAGCVPNWPGTNAIADRIVSALVMAGIRLPGADVAPPPRPTLAGFPEAGYEGSGS